MMHESSAFPLPSASRPDMTTYEYYEHSHAPRINTDTVLVESLKRQYPQLELTVVESIPCDLLSYAASTGQAKVTPIIDAKEPLSEPLSWTTFAPPARRMDGAQGLVVEKLKFGKFLYAWKEHDFILYVANGRDGSNYFPAVVNQYLLGPVDGDSKSLISDCGAWALALHDEIWVFDGGMWQKDSALYKSVQKASWKDVILDESMKEALQDDVNRFFDSRERYSRLRVPWKRGAIYWGPPGNGKTVSIKATMKTLYDRKDPIPSLYVRSLSSFAGPEYSIKTIFKQARLEAPCLLIFEDLDSLIGDDVRSYLYNEMDGLQANDGVLIVGSTNHLDRLDPGMSKRPSRFDRKFEFPKPNVGERIKYAEFWQKKLRDNEEIEFPDSLCSAIAGITDGFSFAYMQEAFVASLLAIAAQEADDSGHLQADGDLDNLVLWREIKRQVKILREEL
ncbi:hypothetical protein FH972_021901 [Carpinus fangiana]|uniref:AAA+ ATPase domain-containing protein n=1 Tax=Carpinus fangiana TaxID=176857 RepID=A0A5N6KSU2_9ROSI|nr:hypothetical protein FH972_021901 [Carpinus fangiana]